MTRGALALATVLLAQVARGEVRATLPPRPWDLVEHLELPSAAGAALLPRPGGGAAALLSGPSGVAVIDLRGQMTSSWRIDAAPAGLAWWVGPDVLHLARGREGVLSYAVDGTLRGRAFAGDSLAGGVSLPDGTGAVIAFRAASTLLATTVGWDLGSNEGIPARAGWRPAATAPCVDEAGGVWVAAGAGLLRVHPTERALPVTAGIRALLPRRGGGLLVLAESALLLLDAAGRTVGRVPLDATVIDLAAMADGGAAVLIQTTPPTVLLVDGSGARRARFDAPRDARALTPDEAGAVLVASRDGELAVYDAAGAPRWRLTVPARLRPPVIPLSPLRYAVATESAEILTLSLAETTRRP
ncbi:MAG: hypothetical protein U0325_08500 [Polyangiales bacterium]